MISSIQRLITVNQKLNLFHMRHTHIYYYHRIASLHYKQSHIYTRYNNYHILII